MELDGKLALVTGAGRGIGKAIALALAEVGADAIINDISERDARETVSAVEAKGKTSVYSASLT